MTDPRNDTAFVEFDGGAVILDGSTPADALYVIERGRVQLARAGAMALELHEGDVFGETALLQPPQPAHATARTPVRLLRIEVALLPQVLQAQPALALPLLRQLAHRAQPDAWRQGGDTPPGLAAVVLPGEAPPAPVAEPSGAFFLRHTEGRFVLPAAAGECLVGRPDPATGAVPEVNLGPLDLARSLSRRHARLLIDGAGGIALREEPGVSNGTWVNGTRLATGEVAALKRGDRLRFGAIEVELARE